MKDRRYQFEDASSACKRPKAHKSPSFATIDRNLREGNMEEVLAEMLARFTRLELASGRDQEEKERHRPSDKENQPPWSEVEAEQAKEGEELRARYDWLVGYLGRYNAVKELLGLGRVWLVRADSVQAVWGRVGALVVLAGERHRVATLYCVLHGVPVVREEWVRDCLERREMLPVGGYAVEVGIGDGLFGKMRIGVYAERNGSAKRSIDIRKESEVMQQTIVKGGGCFVKQDEGPEVLIVQEGLSTSAIAKAKKEFGPSLMKLVNTLVNLLLSSGS